MVNFRKTQIFRFPCLVQNDIVFKQLYLFISKQELINDENDQINSSSIKIT